MPSIYNTMPQLMQRRRFNAQEMFTVKSNYQRILTVLVPCTLALLTLGCSSARDTEAAYYSQTNKRIYHTDLYNAQVSGVSQYQQGFTSRVEGSSPLTSDIFMLNAEQKAAIARVQMLREERANAAF